MKAGLQRAAAAAALVVLLNSAAAAQSACTQSMLTGDWILEISLVRGVIHGCAIHINAKGKFTASECTTPDTVTFTELPAGNFKLGSTCRVTGSFCYSTSAVPCATDVSLSSQDSLMWLSNDSTRVSGFGRGTVKLSGGSTGDIGVVPLELVSKSPKVNVK